MTEEDWVRAALTQAREVGFHSDSDLESPDLHNQLLTLVRDIKPLMDEVASSVASEVMAAGLRKLFPKRKQSSFPKRKQNTKQERTFILNRSFSTRSQNYTGPLNLKLSRVVKCISVNCATHSFGLKM